MPGQKLHEDIEALRRRLEEAEETIKAIRDGAVDAIVVEEQGAHRIYTLDSADRPYRLLVEQTQQGAATLDTEGTITYGNISLADLLEMPLERLIGAPLHDFVSSDDQARYQALFREGQESASKGEIELRRTGGGVIPSYIAFSALRDNAAVGVLVTDLTAQKREAELAAANDVLRETNRLKDDFLMTLSHELRTPLNAILGWAHMLRDDTLSPDTQRRALDAVARNAEAQAQLVEDLLDVSRIVSGKLEIKHETVNLATVAEAAAETMLFAAEERMKTMTDKIKIAPCLWFSKNAEEAAKFYAATFPDSHVTAVRKAPGNYPSGKAGDVLTVEFTVLGQPFVGLNGGPEFNFNEAVSFQVFTDTQEETDRYWNALVGGGGQESVCGWCKDRFGLSWQIVPRALSKAMNDPDTAAAKRAMDAMMTMKKIDIARIEAARAGDAHAVGRA